MPASVDANALGPRRRWRALPRVQRVRIAGYVSWIICVTLTFGESLAHLMLYASQSELFSYIPLVPFVAVYLLYHDRKGLPQGDRTSIGGTAILCGLATVAMVAAANWRDQLSVNDGLSLHALAYLSLIGAGGFLFFGSRWMAAALFPAAFLLFMVPLPDAAVYWLEHLSVLASADVSEILFKMAGTPLVREGTVFALPGIVLHIAQECSGIHSSWVLFITSTVASKLFLSSRWRRLILVAFVFPLAIVRNSVRIVTIGLLSVHVGPHMLDSWIHHQGGPVFFALSLGPLFLLLAWLRWRERR